MVIPIFRPYLSPLEEEVYIKKIPKFKKGKKYGIFFNEIIVFKRNKLHLKILG